MGKPSRLHICILILPIDATIDSQENICGRVNNRENHECFPFKSCALYSVYDKSQILDYKQITAPSTFFIKGL